MWQVSGASASRATIQPVLGSTDSRDDIQFPTLRGNREHGNATASTRRGEIGGDATDSTLDSIVVMREGERDMREVHLRGINLRENNLQSATTEIAFQRVTSNALELLSSRDAQREWPLVMIGPGGDFTRRYVASGQNITRERAVPHAQTVSAVGATDRTADEDSPMFRDGFGLRNALRQVRERFAAIAHEIFTTTTIVDDDQTDDEITDEPINATGGEVNVKGNLSVDGVAPEEKQSQSEARRTRLEGNHDESHSEATPRPTHDSRLSSNAGVLANDAGDRRPTRRQQSYGVRARRSAHREGSADSGQEQGTLFVDCA